MDDAAGREPRFDEAARPLGLAVEEPDAHGEDHVEAPVAEVEILEACDEELGDAGLDVRGVAAGGGRDHLGRAVDRGQAAAVEPLAHERRGDAVAAADLEHAVVRPEAELVDDGAQSFAHTVNGRERRPMSFAAPGVPLRNVNTNEGATMTKVYAGGTMSLDGYISGPDESGFEHLFQWYGSGDVEIPTTHDDLTFRVTPTDAEHIRTIVEETGVLVVGRHLFDMTNGWGGSHPLDRPVVVVTHNVPDGWPRDDAPFTFVTDGIEAAIAKAKEIAGDKVVGVNGGQIARQCLEAGLLDEIWVDLAPVLLGGGRPFFDQVAGAPYALEGPVSVVEGANVTHLRYRVRKA